MDTGFCQQIVHLCYFLRWEAAEFCEIFVLRHKKTKSLNITTSMARVFSKTPADTVDKIAK